MFAESPKKDLVTKISVAKARPRPASSASGWMADRPTALLALLLHRAVTSVVVSVLLMRSVKVFCKE